MLFSEQQLLHQEYHWQTHLQQLEGLTTIHLDEYNGYFSADETLAGLKAGEYEFIIENKAGKLVGFCRNP